MCPIERTSSPASPVRDVPAAAVAASGARCARDIRDPNASTAMAWLFEIRKRSVAGWMPGAGPITTAHASQPIEGTSHPQGAAVHDVQIDHRGPDVCMTKQSLHGSDVVAVFEQ